MKKSIAATIILFTAAIVIILMSFGFEDKTTYKSDGTVIEYPKEENVEESEEDKTFVSHENKITPLLSSFLSRDYGKQHEVDLEKDILIDTETIEGDKKISLEEYENEYLMKRGEVFYSNYDAVPEKKRKPRRVPSVDTESVMKLIEKAEANTASLSGKDAVKLSLEKSKILRFEILPLYLDFRHGLDIDEVKVYVRRAISKELRKNGDSRYTLDIVRTKDGRYKSVYLHRFGYPVGAYEFVVYIGGETPRVYTKRFYVDSRKMPIYDETQGVITMEYIHRIKNKSIPAVDGGTDDYDGFYDWARFMEAASFWVLGGASTGWDSTLSPKKRWNEAPIENTMLLADSRNKKDIKLGAYIMSYYTPGYGNIKAGYNIGIKYSRKNDSLVSSRHISLSCEQRKKDILELFTKFQSDRDIDYFGLDFIRSGENVGMEMVDEFVEKTGLKMPAGWSRMSKKERMLWLGRTVNYGSRAVSWRWRWYRAHKVASLVRYWKDQGVNRPIWVFTLGWAHGVEHGQDPYMFLDAGARIDAVMLYEVEKRLYHDMMIHWKRYLNGANNVFIGNMMDKYLNDGGYVTMEYARRLYKGVKMLDGSARVRGLFYHDISRAFWSSRRGVDIKEWSYVNAATLSRVREKYSETPLKVEIELDEKSDKGKLIVKNISRSYVKYVDIEAYTGDQLKGVKLERDGISFLAAGKQDEIPFSYRYKSGKYKEKAFIAFDVKLRSGKRNINFVYTHSQKEMATVYAD